MRTPDSIDNERTITTEFTRQLAQRWGLSTDAAEARLENLVERYVPVRRADPRALESMGSVRKCPRNADGHPFGQRNVCFADGASS